MRNFSKLLLLAVFFPISHVLAQTTYQGQIELDLISRVDNFDEANRIFSELAKDHCKENGYSLYNSAVNIKSPSGDFAGIFSCHGSLDATEVLRAVGLIRPSGAYLYVTQIGEELKPVQE